MATIQHIGTDPQLLMPFPDYDYTAFIEETTTSKAKVRVEDPTGKDSWYS